LSEHRDTNFASMFPVWDRIFGTEYTGAVVNEAVGVDANYHNVRGLSYDLVESVRRAFKAVPTVASHAAPASAPETPH
jgi:sterol desaturase/sphingolipid hydroxylase (fatty acid hydroxylase superfamily)